jgi:hypothetical protein
MDLISQYDCFERLREFSGYAVILGVALEVAETIKDVIPTRDEVEWSNPLAEASDGSRLIPGQKAPWQKWFSFGGWVILFFGLIFESHFERKSREVDLQIRSTSEQQIEALKTELHELKSRSK